MRSFLLLLYVLILSTGIAHAENNGEQKLLGTFGAWKAFSYHDAGSPVCYMVKEARLPSPSKSKLKRGAAYLMITHRPEENNKDVVSYASGFNLKPSSNVTMHFGTNSFDMFVNKDTAWSRDSKTDRALALALTTNMQVKISATPAVSDLKNITDTLDLKGASAAYHAINVACGYENEPKQKPQISKKKKNK